MGNQGTVQRGGHAPVPSHPREKGRTYLRRALLELGRLRCTSGQAQAAVPVAAAALALGALQAQLPRVLHHEAGREDQIPLCRPLNPPPGMGPAGLGGCQTPALPFGWGSALLPAPPSLLPCSISSVWPKIPPAEVLVSAGLTGIGLRHRWESVPPAHCLRAPQGGGPRWHRQLRASIPSTFRLPCPFAQLLSQALRSLQPPKTQHAIPTCLSFPSHNKFCSQQLQPSPRGSPT